MGASKKPKAKYWEARTANLPIPIWLELEKRYCPMKSRKNSGYGWMGHLSIVAELVNYFCIKPEQYHYVYFDLSEAFLDRRREALHHHFDANGGDQAAAEKAMMDEAEPLPADSGWVGHPDDEIALLASRLRGVGYATSTGPQGFITTTPVTGNIGGSLIISAGVSKILTYDAVTPANGARSVQLVGGTRTLTNNSTIFTAGQVLTYTTTWIGTLEVVANPSGASGSFNILRGQDVDGSTTGGGIVSVTPGATLQIDSGTTANAGGNADAFTDTTTSTRHVAIVNNGTFNVTRGFKTIQSLTGSGATSISAGAGLALAAAAANHTLTVLSSVSIGTTGSSAGKLDIANRDLLVHTGSIPVDGLNEVVSSFALANGATAAGAVMSGSDYALITGSTILDSTQTVLPGDTVIKFTYGGDASLDGKIGIDDYLLTDQGYLKHLTGWIHGDFNRDGTVGPVDYAILDNNYAHQSGTLADSEIALHTAEFGSAYTDALLALNASPVPEPASLAVLGIGTVGLLSRRRRRSE